MQLACDGQLITPAWTTSYVDDVCDNRAHVVDPATIEITWNPKGQDPSPELIAKSQSNRRFGRAPAADKALRGQ